MESGSPRVPVAVRWSRREMSTRIKKVLLGRLRALLWLAASSALPEVRCRGAGHRRFLCRCHGLAHPLLADLRTLEAGRRLHLGP